MFYTLQRYKILNPKAVDVGGDEKKIAVEVLNSVGLANEKYRTGNTKVSLEHIIRFY